MANPDAGRAGDGETDPAEDGIPGLWFFLPLPHPIGLPAGWRSELALPPPALLRSGRLTSGLASSLLIHQVEPTRHGYLEDMAELMSFAIQTMKSGTEERSRVDLDRFMDEVGNSLSPLHSIRTIAEIAVPGFDGIDEDEVLRALDLAISHVRWVQRAVAMATSSGVRLIARETLPPSVPTFAGVAHFTTADDPKPRPPEVRSGIEYFIPNCAPSSALGIRPEPFDARMLDRVARFSDHVISGAPFDVYTDIRREAMVQRSFDGNSRLAVVALASAGEVLLDTALLHMLWEEHVPPRDAAALFDRNEGHTARVSRQFPGRLGGGWYPEANSPAGRYLRDLVRLRHRVVHAGHDPSSEELEAAWSALFDLERYLGDRLAAGSNLKKYGRTAMAWMAESGLRQRNRWTRFIRELGDDRREPSWVETFGRWRRHVDRALDDSAPRPGANVDDLMLYAELIGDDALVWKVHDASTCHAAIVDPSRGARPKNKPRFSECCCAWPMRTWHLGGSLRFSGARHLGILPGSQTMRCSRSSTSIPDPFRPSDDSARSLQPLNTLAACQAPDDYRDR